MSADRLKIESSETRKTFFENQKKEKFDTKTVDEYQEKYVSEEINRNIAPQETSKSDPETDNTQVVIGISVGIATTSLIVLIMLVIYTV